MAQIKITLTKSPIGRIPAQRRTVKALGLGKLGSFVIKEDIPAVRGMAESISHLVTMEKSGAKAEKSTSSKKTAVKVATEKNVRPNKSDKTKVNNESPKKAVEKAVESNELEKPKASNKVAEIKAYLDANNIKYPSTAKKADLLALVK